MKKRALIVAAAVIVVAVVAVAFWPGEREPEYQGRKLSEWLAIGNVHSYDAGRALKGMGTNVLPQMMKWLRYERPRWRQTLISGYFELPKPVRNKAVEEYLCGSRERRADLTLIGFHLLGAHGAPAVPELISLLQNTNAPQTLSRAAFCLGFIGRDARPAVKYLQSLAGTPAGPAAASAIGDIARSESEFVRRSTEERIQKMVQELIEKNWVPMDENRVWHEQ